MLFVVLVKGHLGRLVFGSLGGVDVVVMQGRIHAYEDHSMWQVRWPDCMLCFSYSYHILLLSARLCVVLLPSLCTRII